MKKFLTELKKLLSGKDGEISIRRLLGAFLIIAGTIKQLLTSEIVGEGLWPTLFGFSGLILAVLGALLILGVTAQHITEAIASKRKGV